MTYDSTLPYPRDLAGHGRNPPHARWPGGARIAVQFVLNYEEGGENCVLHGDAGSEQFLSEMFNPASFPARHISMEGIYEYGSRAGVWRILREFEKRGLPLTVFGVTTALQRSPDVTAAFLELGHEIMKQPLSRVEMAALDLFDEVMHDPAIRLDMMLQPGDIQFANNYAVLHSRNEFEDDEDLTKRRKMIRLWLKMANARELAPEFPGRNGFPAPVEAVVA